MRVIAVLFVLSQFALAQVPDAPSAVQQTSQQKPTLTRSFWIAAGAAAGATIADVETTAAGLNRGCVEGNTTFYGRHPSRGRLYAIAGGTTAGIVLFSYWLKKRDTNGDKNPWFLPVLIKSGAHSAAAIHNAGLSCR